MKHKSEGKEVERGRGRGKKERKKETEKGTGRYLSFSTQAILNAVGLGVSSPF